MAHSSLLFLGVENRVPNQCWSSVGLVHSSRLGPGVARSLPVSYEPRLTSLLQASAWWQCEVIPALYHSSHMSQGNASLLQASAWWQCEVIPALYHSYSVNTRYYVPASYQPKISLGPNTRIRLVFRKVLIKYPTPVPAWYDRKKIGSNIYMPQ